MQWLPLLIALLCACGCNDRPDDDQYSFPISVSPHIYRIQPTLEAAIRLQALGKDAAITVLRTMAAKDDHETGGLQTSVLCRLLFRDIECLYRGAPGLIGGTEHWPLLPITLHEGIPIMVTTDYRLAGMVGSAEMYLERCIEKGKWVTEPYVFASTKRVNEALESFIKSTPWPTPLSDGELRFLRSQSSPMPQNKWQFLRSQ